MGNFSNDSDAGGRRVRLRPKANAIEQIYGSGLLNPLRATNGMVWPYTPTITYQQDVNYTTVDLVHTNQELYAYNRTNALKLTVSGQFSVQNQTEGIYALACIHFLRTVTKMWFGASKNPGTPPPVLLFDAYGQYMFNQLPVIVTTFTVGMPNDVDYVPVDLSNTGVDSTSSSTTNTPSLNTYGMLADIPTMAAKLRSKNLDSGAGYVWLPAVFNIDVGITVQNTPSRLLKFDLDQFRSGALLQQGKWV
jgi:hypothetical protein